MTAVATTLTPILTKFWDDPQSWTLATYEKNEGYQALEKALTMQPADLVQRSRPHPDGQRRHTGGRVLLGRNRLRRLFLCHAHLRR